MSFGSAAASSVTRSYLPLLASNSPHSSSVLCPEKWAHAGWSLQSSQHQSLALDRRSSHLKSSIVTTRRRPAGGASWPREMSWWLWCTKSGLSSHRWSSGARDKELCARSNARWCDLASATEKFSAHSPDSTLRQYLSSTPAAHLCLWFLVWKAYSGR